MKKSSELAARCFCFLDLLDPSGRASRGLGRCESDRHSYRLSSAIHLNLYGVASLFLIEISIKVVKIADCSAIDSGDDVAYDDLAVRSTGQSFKSRTVRRAAVCDV